MGELVPPPLCWEVTWAEAATVVAVVDDALYALTHGHLRQSGEQTLES